MSVTAQNEAKRRRRLSLTVITGWADTDAAESVSLTHVAR
jgi:hypothetical protein